MNLPHRTRTIIAFVLLSITVALLYRFREVLPTFIVALLLAYILTPLVVWISSKRIFKRKISRGMAIIGIYLLSITGISFGGTYFIVNLTNEMQTLVKDIPQYGEYATKHWVPAITKATKTISGFLPKIEKKQPVEPEQDEQKKNSDGTIKKQKPENELQELFYNTRFEVRQSKNGYEVIPHPISKQKKLEEDEERNLDIEKMIDDVIANFIENLQNILLNLVDWGQMVVFSVVNSLFKTMITLMITAFLIIDYEIILNFFRNLFPVRFLNNLERFLQKQNAGLHGVVRGQLIICLVNGVFTGVGLILLDIKFALTLSILATICSLIPIFGVIISTIPIVLMAITNSLWTGILAVGWILLIHFIEGNILNPKIIGKSAEIHPVLVIFALMAGERTYGLFGALIAVPLFSILQTTFIFIRELIFEAEREKERLDALSQD